jgi:hypothetical protein
MREPEIVLLKREFELATCTVFYRLLDMTNKCILDEWQIKNVGDADDMKRDLSLMGYDSLCNHNKHGAAAAVMAAGGI